MIDSADLSGDIARTQAAELAGYLAAIDTLLRRGAPTALAASLVDPEAMVRRSYLTGNLLPWAARARLGKYIALLRLAGDLPC
ncbi:hypothetical protein [Sphingomonas sp. SRS2]|uniref:hypothetical protein n=1 Tax=Sphingomonas sp. SRS2 TaxID=133190 RepID=UPI0006184BC5|nr:hypothetical protein [Sphingomonas sp. SRS2]KKC24870.1 hypothetical protein WP12_16690 [Sphingomonas sp. SRS2]